jgi:hypothetical protein
MWDARAPGADASGAFVYADPGGTGQKCFKDGVFAHHFLVNESQANMALIPESVSDDVADSLPPGLGYLEGRGCLPEFESGGHIVIIP